MKQGEEDESLSLKSLIEATIVAQTEAINNPTVENKTRADTLWEQLNDCFQESPEVVKETMKRFRQNDIEPPAKQ